MSGKQGAWVPDARAIGLGILGLLLAGAPLLTLAGCRRAASTVPVTRAQASTVSSQGVVVPVAVAPVRRGTLEERVALVGVLAAERKTAVAAQSTGRVVAVAVREGDAVQAGQALVMLDDEEARMRVAAAEAEVRAARERAGIAESDVRIVEIDTRVTEAQAAGNVRVARARLEQARADLAVTRERIAGEIAIAKAQLASEQAKLRLLQAGPRPQELARARAELEGATVSVSSAEREAALVQKEWERKQGLAKKGFLPRKELEDAESALQQAHLNVERAQAQQRSLAEAVRLLEGGARAEEIEQARAQVCAAEESLRLAQKNQSAVKQKEQAVAAAEAELASAEETLAAARRGDVRVHRGRQERSAVESAVALAEANLRLAREAHTRLSISSPIAGVVTKRHVEPGETVLPGQALLEVADPASLYFDAAVADRGAPRVRAGQPVDLTFDGLKERRLTGRVQQLLPPTDSQRRDFRLRVSLATDDPQLRLGMLGSGSIRVDRHANVILAPVAALLESKGDADPPAVFVVRNGCAYRRPVTLGARSNTEVVVLSGLRAGDVVVTEGQTMLRDGRRVSVTAPDHRRAEGGAADE